MKERNGSAAVRSSESIYYSGSFYFPHDSRGCDKCIENDNSANDVAYLVTVTEPMLIFVDLPKRSQFVRHY